MGIAGQAARGRGPQRARALVWAAALLGPGLLLPIRAPADTTTPAEPPARAGVALRAALDAQARGDSGRAERLLAEIAAREPLVADYADLLRMRHLVAEERWDAAEELGRSWDHAGSPLEAEFRELLGRALAARGEERAARSAWIAALGRTDDSELLASLRLEIARSELRTGNLREAGETFLEIFMRHPLTPADAEAIAALDDLEGRVGPLRRVRQWRRRGDSLFAQRRNEEALAAYDTALALGGASAKELLRIRQKRAHTLFRLRRYPEAVEAFASYPARTPDRIEQARAVARAGDVPAAVRTLERIAGAGGKGATQARLIAALLLEGEGQTQRAREHFAALVRHAPRSAAGVTALWQLGWEAYRAGRHRAAIGYFDKLAPLESDEVSRLRARYWSARARALDGDAARADEAFAALAFEYPLSYYGWRAAGRLDGRALPAAEPVPAVSAAPIPRGRAVLAPSQVERPRILLEAGLVAEARRELDRLFGRARGLDDRLALAELYADAGEFNRPQRLVVDAYAETLSRAPIAAALELWWHAWPAPFFEDVRDATATRRHVDLAVVYAIMREESGYRPEVLSVSGARGLLQLMPATAQKVAQAEAMSGFVPDDLFVPQVNIALGSAYLDELFRRFGGRPSAAIGSYNAGPHRVAQWLEGNALEDDEWVEAIPYDQTRGYVKRVLRSMKAYRVLY